ncbi:MAG: ribbon-helix-helix protein [Ignavibacteria bacterium]|nr:ribbon-helix-helix protein [Ignavibacteria bacterium]
MTSLNHYSKKNKIPKNRIIENAVNYYLQLMKINEYVESFKRAKNDAEMIELADAGFEDYLNIINK